MTMLEHIKKTIFGYDIFISYSRKDSLDYAYSVAQYLIRRGFECYIDQLSSIRPGNELPPNIKDAVRRSTAFVLIGSEGAQQSEAIEQEVQLFLENNGNRPLIPVTIGGAISSTTARWYNLIGGLALVDEDAENLNKAQPAQDVLDRIENALNFTKKSNRLRNISSAIFISVLCMAAAATFFTYSKAKAAKTAIGEKNRADALKNIALQQLFQADSLRTVALKDRSAAIRLKEQAEASETAALIGKAQAEMRKNKADSLKAIAEKRIASLNRQGELLEHSIAATRYLESDPVRAYRIAEEAYRIEKSADNKRLILASLSAIDYYYTSVHDSYRIIDLKDPYILLIDGSRENGPNLAVYDMRTSAIKETSLTTDRIGWIVPAADSYRILTRNWKGEGSDAIPEYQLWSSFSVPLGDKIYGSAASLPNFINNHTVSIDLPRRNETLVWDLQSGANRHVYGDSSDLIKKIFPGAYRALDVRSDGKAATYYDHGLVLLDTNGRNQADTYTEVSFDPSPFFSRAEWSSDDGFLALNYFDRGRLGIWSPSTSAFVWLDPGKWVVDAYAWSQKGHLLAFSGRTENDVNVTVEIADASAPERTRKVVYRGEVPIRNISFLPGDTKVAICDKESNMLIVEIASGKIIGKGQQADAISSSSSGFYSSSSKDFKSWNGSPAPSKNWLYKSDSIRTYQAKGAVDTKNRWMAVPYYQAADSSSGVELRRVLTREKKSLGFSGDYVHRIEFSTSGTWLALETSDTINLWSTESWKLFQFPLLAGDRQFIGLIVRSDTLYAQLAFDSAGYEIEYSFDLTGGRPEFIRRSVSNRASKNNYRSVWGEAGMEDATIGWKMDKLYKYQSAGWAQSGSWAVRLTCRDNPLGAHDCDVQFIPTDLDWLMSVYDQLLWKPDKKKLRSLVHGD